MKVETYEVEEVAEIAGTDPDCESLEIIQKVGLTGQQALIAKKSETNQNTRCPYRVITDEEDFVYRTLCPQSTPAASYSDSPIPLRILQIIAWAHDNKFFKRLEIWAATSATVKDPVLVGISTTPGQEWRERVFLLGRWGEELLPLDVLIPDAIRRWRELRKAKIIEIQGEAAQALAMVDNIQSIPRAELRAAPYAAHLT